MFWGKRSNDGVPAPIEALSDHVDAWEELAIDYLDGRLDQRTRAAVDQHLAGCPACASRLQLQQVAIDYIKSLPLKDAPPALEAAVVSEALFPSRAARPVGDIGLERPVKWSDSWQRRRNSWIPASAIVAAVLVAVVGFAILRSSAGSLDEVASTTVVAAGPTAQNTDAGSPRLETGATPEDTQYPDTAGMASLDGTATTAASATTLAVDGGDIATIKAAGTPILERTEMIGGMIAVTDSPVYFVFESEPATAQESQPEGVTGSGTAATTQTTVLSPVTSTSETFVTADQAEAVAAQITALTGLEPLDEGLAFSRPTFAAYVPKDQAPQFIDLLRSIATSEDLVVELNLEPGEQVTEWVGALLERMTVLVALSAQRVPSPAVSSWSFTTSTLLPPSADTGSLPQATMPGDAGTLVLVVVLVNTPR